ncbi:MAG: hypothetical protein K8I60_12590, partial [Anaerolineae bacterium]|nr:hypothetical protein [Anaerolineae bacterium]
WQREHLIWWRSAAIGLTLGLLAITRSNQAVLVATWILLLAFTARGWRRLGLHIAVSAFFFGLVIAPVAIWNRQHGSSQLITSVGTEEVYRGNNRDASGLNDRSLLADSLVDNQDYTGSLLRDIFRNPRRFIDLQIRKTGLYWGASEPANNISYQDSGEAVSPLLRSIPLNFSILAFLGWLGAFALLRRDRRTGIFFTAMQLLMFIGVMVTWTEGRLKQPSVIPLVALSTYGIICLLDWLHEKRQVQVAKITHPARQIWVWSGTVIALLVIGGWLHWAVDNLPANRPVTALPTDVRRIDVVFDDTLRLIGWRPLPDWPAGERGWSHYFARTYAVELFWDVLQPTSTDYNVYLAYVDEGIRYAGVDRAIGTVSYPGTPTSAWHPGEVYSEILGFRLAQDTPRERSGDIRLGVYRVEGEGDSRQLFSIAATSLPNAPDSIVLQKLAIYDLGQLSVTDRDLPATDINFGGKIVLLGYSLPEIIESGKPVTLALEWAAVEDMSQDYVMLGHAQDDQGETVTYFDTPPRGNTLVTSTWPPDYRLQDHVTFNLPEQPGVYSIYIGWYDPVSGERLPTGTADSRVLLGMVTVVRP